MEDPDAYFDKLDDPAQVWEAAEGDHYNPPLRTPDDKTVIFVSLIFNNEPP